MKAQIEELFAQALTACGDGLLPEGETFPAPIVERTRDPQHGDFACNIAMVLAKPARKNPREIAQAIIAAFPKSGLVETLAIAGPGFINVRLAAAAYHAAGRRDHCRGRQLRPFVIMSAPQTVLVEFVSANPTGPLHVGHGRHAAYGATVANLLEAVGYTVHREYYVNDAGRQMDILALSTWLRYLVMCGEEIEFPSNGYRGDYITDIAQQLYAEESDRLHQPADELLVDIPPDAPAGDKEKHVDALIERMRHMLSSEDYRRVLDCALDSILLDIRDDLEQFGVTVDTFFSERTLYESGQVDEVISRLEAQDLIYSKGGAKWFRATQYGDEKDRVVVRDNGQKTYIASDIAYHFDKRRRGHELLLDILGADHHGYVARVRAGLEAMGEPADSLEVRLVQFAVLVSRWRESADVYALRRVCDAAPAARRSGG